LKEDISTTPMKGDIRCMIASHPVGRRVKVVLWNDVSRIDPPYQEWNSWYSNWESESITSPTL